MKTLLLAAKAVAIEQSRREININHLRTAVTKLDVVDTELARRYAALLKERLNKHSFLHDDDLVMFDGEINAQLLQKAISAPRKYFDDQLSQFIDKLPAPLNQASEGPEIFRLPPVVNKFRSRLSGYQQVKSHLLSEVYGQDEVIEAMVDSLSKNAWHSNEAGPAACFLFLGPPATGKSYLAERFGHHMGRDYKFARFDMAQYTNHNEAFGLVGSKKTYTDSAPGKLTQLVKKHPRCVLFFDEFEKAHTQVLQSLLQLFSTGFLEDQHTGERVDFRQCMVIFASNLGQSMYTNQAFSDLMQTNQSQARASVLANIANETKIESQHSVKAIPAELLSRLSQGEVLLFNRLTLNNLVRIAHKQLAQDIQLFAGSSGIEVAPPEHALSQLLLLKFAPQFDIREIKAHISASIIDPVTDLLRDTETDIQHLDIVLDNSVSLFLKTHCHEQGQKALSLKHQTVTVSTQIDCQSSRLTLSLCEPRVEHLVLAADVGATAGLTVDFPDVSFDNIAGHTQIKQRMKETINILQQRKKLAQSNVTPPAGMLLYGPPGTGKTMLARAFAKAADLPFIACNGADLLGDKFVETLFERARKYAPSIIFIDEVDALPKRGSAGPLADAIVNRLLTEIDGFKTTEQGIFVIAATNHVDKLDSALTRSGRLDLKFNVPSLDKGARRWFLERMLAKGDYQQTMDIDYLLLLTAGLSGADLEKIHREAVLKQVREGLASISQELLVEEINTLKFGARRKDVDIAKKLQATAYHEAGHAVLSRILMPEREIEQVTVTPRANSLGRVSFDQDQDIDETRQVLFALTCIALAGRAAQLHQFADEGMDSGASADLKMAMRCAYAANVQLGMGELLPNVDVSSLQKWSQLPLYQQQIETQIKQWVDEATQRTQSLIEQHWNKIEALTQALLEREILSGTEVDEILRISS